MAPCSLTDGTAFSPQLVGLTGTGTRGRDIALTFQSCDCGLRNSSRWNFERSENGADQKYEWRSGYALIPCRQPADFSVVGKRSNSVRGWTAFECQRDLRPECGPSRPPSVQAEIFWFDPRDRYGGDRTRQAANLNGRRDPCRSRLRGDFDFCGADRGDSSAAQTVTITNNLAATANLAIAGGGEFLPRYPVGATPCGATLASHAQCTVNLTFTPSGVGNRTGSITITSSGKSGGADVLELRGPGSNFLSQLNPLSQNIARLARAR